MVPDEVEYFSEHLELPVQWYLDHFDKLLASAPHRSTPYVLGEKSARYCSISSDRITLIRRLLPDAKLILMTRDPVSRHWAQAKRYFSKKRFDKYGGGVLSVPRDELFDFFTRMRRLGQFSRMIEAWTAVFPRGQLLILSQESTLAAPREAFDNALAHIGVSQNYDPESISLLMTQKNRGPSVPMPDDVAAFLDNMFATEREALRQFTRPKAGV